MPKALRVDEYIQTELLDQIVSLSGSDIGIRIVYTNFDQSAVKLISTGLNAFSDGCLA
ncbi:hypothetical protein OPIT5_00290 (plasmid) [Opitutaceae bacterium TAV5]|nr:hypothetical protein OPIT5_00290 [Opitutaceae bacterium TAV5]